MFSVAMGNRPIHPDNRARRTRLPSRPIMPTLKAVPAPVKYNYTPFLRITASRWRGLNHWFLDSPGLNSEFCPKTAK